MYLVPPIVLAVLLIIGGAGRASTQVLYGSVVGVVTDPSAAPVPGASVRIINADTGQTRETQTNELGVYNFSTVLAGPYDITFSKTGFAPFTRQSQVVTTNSVLRVDVPLRLGAVSESVVVRADAAVLQTDRAEVRHEVTRAALENIPIAPGRNYAQLFVMLPGFTPPFNSGSVAANPSRALQYNVNGTSGSSNNVRIDGTGANAIWVPNRATYVPTLEAIETVNVVTNSFDAEQGLAGSSSVNVQIKSGTNELHGSAFEFHNNNKTKAKPFFLPQGERNPKAVYNQFGGTLGGPIRKNKLFFFASYEGTYDRQTAAQLTTVPTAAIRSGDMSASPRLVYDPNTGTADGSGRAAFPEQIVPRSRIEPIIQKLVDLTPMPSYPQLLTSNYYANGALQFDRHTVDTKINWNPTNKLTLYGRLGMLKHYMDSPTVFGEVGGPHIAGFAGFAGIVKGTSFSTSIAGTYTVKPNLIIDANFGWNLLDTDGEQKRLDEKLGLDYLGIPGTNGPRRFQGDWPLFGVTSYTQLGSPFSPWPIIWHDPAWYQSTNASWIHGTHSIRFGFEVSRQHMNHISHELAGASGTGAGGFTFTGGVTTVRGGQAANQFNSYADFLLGLPSTIGKIQMVPDEVTTRSWLESLYIRDQWQATRRLTISYGTRWEYFPMPTRADRGLELYDANTNKMRVCGVGVVPRDCGVRLSKSLFAPRFGLAWRAMDTLVVRAGYGITIDPYSLARPLRTNYPTLIGLTLTGANAFVPAGTIKEGIPPIVAPDLGNGIIDVPTEVVVNTLPDEFPRGYIQSWNFTLQKNLPGGFVGQAGYVATRQVRQTGFQELNPGYPGGGNASRPLFQKFRRTTNTRMVAPVGTGHYNALQTSLERRFSAGYQIQLAYTWSKAMGICCNNDSDGLAAIVLPEYNLLNRAVTGYDRTHNLQISSVAELPFGRGKRWANEGGIAGALADGWRINTLFSAYSGTPFSVTAAATSLDAPGNTQRADQVKSDVQKLGGTGPGQSFFDPFAFASVTTARFGTAGFNSLRGPGAVNLDLGISRDFRITERVHAQFRAEVFNATNTPHFANPGNNVSNLQLNPDGSIRSLGGYTEITSTNGRAREGQDERNIRFGLRFSF